MSASHKINGAPLVYLDNAATTQKPEAVIEAICSAVLFLGLMSDWLFLERVEGGSWWASILYTVTPNWQNFWLADVLEGDGIIPLGYIGQAFGYLVGYVGATLSVALWLFEDRELT